MKDLTRGNIYKTFLLFAIPLMLSGLLSQAYSIVDTMIAGRFLGDAGLSAIGATADLINLASSTFWGINAGLGMLTASLFGAKDFVRMRNTLYSTFLFFFSLMVALSIALVLFREPIFDFLKVDPAIRHEAAKYFIVYTLGFSLIVTNDFGICTLNALGVSSFPFKMSLLSMVLNISGNLLAVTVLDLGVLGIALSSVLAALVVDLFYFLKIRKCMREIEVLRTQKTKLSFRDVRASLIYALPPGGQQTVMYVASFLILPIINGAGPAATAAYVVIMRIYGVVAAVYQNSSKTVSNYVAQSVGAGKGHLIPKGLRVGLLQALLFATPFVALFAIAPKTVSSIFFPPNFTGEALTYTVTFARFCLPFILFNVVNNLFHSFFRGVASAKLLLISTAVGTVSRLAITFALMGLGMNAVFIGWAGSWIIEAIFCLILYLFYVRKKYAKA